MNLRFIERNGKKVLQFQKSTENGVSFSEGLWQDVPVKTEEKKVPMEPAVNQDYWYINCFGEIGPETAYNPENDGDAQCYAAGNCYLAKEIAEHEARYLAAYRKLRNIARELNEGKELGSLIYYCCFPVTKGEAPYVRRIHKVYREAGQIIFFTAESAEQALALLTDEEKEVLANG